MLLTKKTSGVERATDSAFVNSLRRGISHALPTMDRRTFLRRSGLGVGAGIAATQLGLVRKASAADGKIAVGNTKIKQLDVCSALVEQEDVFGLDIAMHHPRLVCFGQRLTYLLEDLGRPRQTERSFVFEHN